MNTIKGCNLSEDDQLLPLPFVGVLPSSPEIKHLVRLLEDGHVFLEDGHVFLEDGQPNYLIFNEDGKIAKKSDYARAREGLELSFNASAGNSTSLAILNAANDGSSRECDGWLARETLPSISGRGPLAGLDACGRRTYMPMAAG
jgi:hypothetical protein